MQNANANPGSTISLIPSATYMLTDTFKGELVLSTTTTIDSNNGPCGGTCRAVIKGGAGWTTRLVELAPGAAVAVSNIIFTGGNANNGGAILNSGTLTLTTSQIFSNTVNGYGGGILNYGSLTLTNTVINGNKALIVGGGIANQAGDPLPGALTINNSSIITNSVYGAIAGTGFGGGIASFDNISGTIHPTMTLSGSSILSNTTDVVGLGGGLYLFGTNTLTNVTMQGNASGSGGGADVTGQLSMQGGVVLSNTGAITGGGGGLYLNAVTSLINVTVQGNSASGGGGIDVAFGQLDMQGGSVVSNTATTSSGGGGGIRADGPLTLTNVLVAYNQALGGGAGGAISSNALTLITNSTLTHNHAEGGGGIWLGGFSGLLTLNHSNLISNTSTYGGGIGGYGSSTITNTSVISDNAAYQGGGLNIFSGGSAVVAGGSQVANNSTSGGQISTAHGAGIFNSGQLQVQHATLWGNNAANGSGGALYNATGQANLDGVALLANQAFEGGAIFNESVLTITASALFSNSSLTRGGAIDNNGWLVLLNTTLGANGAESGNGTGGGLFSDNQASLNFVTMADNSANGGGGGLMAVGTLHMSNSLLSGNTSPGAPNCGGDIVSLGHNLIADRTGCTLNGSGTGDKLNVDPKLTTLIDQGGVLRYYDLLDFSPALESADPAGGACPATDQRGVARPQNGVCDIGAVERAGIVFVPTHWLYLPLVRR